MPSSLYRRMPLWELENVDGFRDDGVRPSTTEWIVIFRRTAATSGNECRHSIVWAVLVLAAASFVEVSGLTPLLHAQDATSLAAQLQPLIGQPQWESALWGLHIVSLKDDKVLFSSNARKRF